MTSFWAVILESCSTNVGHPGRLKLLEPIFTIIYQIKRKFRNLVYHVTPLTIPQLIYKPLIISQLISWKFDVLMTYLLKYNRYNAEFLFLELFRILEIDLRHDNILKH